MTPAIKQLKKAQVSFQMWPYKVVTTDTHYGLAAEQALGVSPDRLFKTLMASQDNQPIEAKPTVMAVMKVQYLALHQAA